jgi:hypothetical protein
MSSTTRTQRLARLRNRYECLARSVSAIPLLEGTGEPWQAVREGRRHVLTETSAALTQIPDTLSASQILIALKSVRDQLVASQQEDLARITQHGQPVESAPKEVWRAHGSFPVRVAALQEVEALLPQQWRTRPRARGTALSLVKIHWTEEPDACVYCQLPAFTRLPDEMAGLVLCQEHLAPSVSSAAERAVIKRLEAQLAHRFDLRCTMPLPVAVVENDVTELYRYYTVRWLLAAQRTEDALAYQARRDTRREEEAGLQISMNAVGETVQEDACLSLEVPPTILHRLVLLDLLTALKQADWIEEVSSHWVWQCETADASVGLFSH